MLRQNIQPPGPEFLAVALAFVDRLLGRSRLEEFEAVPRHQERAARLVEPVVGAAYSLEKPRRALWGTHLHDEVDIAPVDPEIEAQGMDIIRSRIELVTRAGETHVQWADERYRGGPDHPMSDAELEEKVAACTDGVIDDSATARLIETAWRAEKLTDAADLARVIQH